MNTRLLAFSCLLFLLPSLAQAEEISITVKGMVCSFCAQGIRKAFGGLPEVEKVNVSLENKLVQLSTKAEGKLEDKRITKLINDAGYDVLKIERKTP